MSDNKFNKKQININEIVLHLVKMFLMATKKKKEAYKRYMNKKKRKTKYKIRSPNKGGLHTNLYVLPKDTVQVTKCEESDDLIIHEYKLKHDDNSEISHNIEDKKTICTQNQEKIYLTARCHFKIEDDPENVLLHEDNEYILNNEHLQSSRKKINGNDDESLKICTYESEEVLCTKGTTSIADNCNTFNNHSFDNEEVKMQSSSDNNHLNELKVFCEKKLKSRDANTNGNDYERNSFYGSERIDLKKDNDHCSSPLFKDNDNQHKEICCNKNENEIMNEVLLSTNIRINLEAINIYIVDDIPRHPPRIGDIQWSWLNEEKWRLHTFSRYPHNAAKSAILLAADGFAYLGTGRDSDDSVICFFCITIKNKWQPVDDISQVHVQLSPCCSFVTKINCTNVPLETSFDGGLFNKLTKPNLNNIRGQENENNAMSSATIFESPEIHIETDGAPLAPPSAGSFPSGTDIGRNGSASLVVSNPIASQQISDRINTSSLQNSETTAAQDTATHASTSSPNASSTLHADSILSHSETPNRERPINTAQTSPTAGQSSNTVTTPPPPQTVTAANQNAVKGNAGGPTYSELGIVTERPKRFEYALLAKRMETFLSWPRDHHLRPKELSEAGFYYAGYGDCARCFYCGGGLRNWEDEDDVWVEHARWFPKCAYIRQQMGQVFVDTVQELNKTIDCITITMVMDEIGHAASAFQLDSKDNPLKRDPAVKTIIDMGFPLAEVIAVAETIKEDGNILSADKIYEKLVAAKIKRNPNKINTIQMGTVGSEAPLTEDIEALRTLREKNNQLRQQTTCKICMDKDVAVVFLPCGHFVSCTDCASAMKDCPVCRNHVKGIVRAFMG